MRKLIATFVLLLLSIPLNVVAIASNSHSTDLALASEQYWSITHAAQTGLNLTTDFTIEAWINLESALGAEATGIVHKGDLATHGNSHYTFTLINDGAQKMRLYVSAGAPSGPSVTLTKAQTFSTATWYHIAVSYDVSAGTAEFFVNGSSIGTTAGGPTTLNASETQPVRIGATSGGGGSPQHYFDGLMDDVRVWSDLRTETELNDNKSNCDLAADAANLVAWWHFNNDELDQTANNNDLTENNGATFSTTAAYACAAAAAPPAIADFTFFQ